MTAKRTGTDPDELTLVTALARVCQTSFALATAGGRSALHTLDTTVDGLLNAMQGAQRGALNTLRRSGGATGATVADYLSLRTQRLLNAFDIPTSRDIHELNARVAELTAEVERLNARPKRRR